MAVQTQIQTRRGTAATWTSTNPTLAAGEIGFETDTNKFKIGTGSTAWTALAYAANTSPLTTKGDLYTYSTADARLAVGNNGETLVADSSTSTGLRYQAPYSQQPVLNSAFQIWQRGTSISAAASSTPYTADRWQIYTNANQATTISRQATGDTTNLPNIQYCVRVQRNSGQTGTGLYNFGQSFESFNAIPFAGKTVTFSFYGRAGANYSATSNALGFYLFTGTGTDQNRVTSLYTGDTYTIASNATLTTTWQRFTATATIPATATEMATCFLFNPTGTASTNDYFEITGVQVEVGSVATPFHTYAATIQGELAACQRYYTRVLASSGNNYYYYTPGVAKSTTVAKVVYTLPMTMRTSPSTTIDYSGLSLYDTVNAAINVTAVTADTPTLNNYSMDITVASGLTQYRTYYLFANNQSGGYLGFSAEL